MKISIHCLGPIHHYEIDLDKSFHIIVGKNSVGKSYALTFIYLILKEFLSIDTWNLHSRLVAATEGPAFKPLLKQLQVWKDYETIDISKPMAAVLRFLLDVVLSDRFHEPVAASFEPLAVLNNQFSVEPFRADIQTTGCTIGLTLTDGRICVDRVLPQGYLLRGVKTYRSPENTAQGRLIYRVRSDIDHLKNVVIGEASTLLWGVANEVSKRMANVHFLPAIRSGLYQALSGLGPIVAELSKARGSIRREISLPRLTVPASDYFLNLSSITTARSQLADSDLDQIARSIEDHILGGTVEYDKDTSRIVFKPVRTDLRLDLAATSSMVSQLSPLVAYFRYVLTEPTNIAAGSAHRKDRPRAMIMIEEPEAHLHPEVQVKLVEQFAALTKIGVKVVLTSHSNYIFNKASNLIISGELSPDTVAATLLTMGENGSEGKALAVDAYGIDDENFVETAESLFMEKTEALANDA